jgi:hypothetical protein
VRRDRPRDLASAPAVRDSAVSAPAAPLHHAASTPSRTAPPPRLLPSTNRSRRRHPGSLPGAPLLHRGHEAPNAATSPCSSIQGGAIVRDLRRRTKSTPPPYRIATASPPIRSDRRRRTLSNQNATALPRASPHPPHDVCCRALAYVRSRTIPPSPVAVAISYDSAAARTIPPQPVRFHCLPWPRSSPVDTTIFDSPGRSHLRRLWMPPAPSRNSITGLLQSGFEGTFDPTRCSAGDAVHLSRSSWRASMHILTHAVSGQVTADVASIGSILFAGYFLVWYGANN